MTDSSTLARRLGLPLLRLNGVGTMVGGGFHALPGRVTALAGGALPIAFLLAAATAALIVVERRGGPLPPGAPDLPIVVPALGAVASLGLVLVRVL